jgi:hypothetical protein
MATGRQVSRLMVAEPGEAAFLTLSAVSPGPYYVYVSFRSL